MQEKISKQEAHDEKNARRGYQLQILRFAQNDSL
jgi:hypothetical protein